MRTFANGFPFYTWLITSQIRSTWPVRSSTPSKNIHIPRDYDLSLSSYLLAILVDLCYCRGQGLWSVRLNQVRRILQNGYIYQSKRVVRDPVQHSNHVKSRSHKPIIFECNQQNLSKGVCTLPDSDSSSDYGVGSMGLGHFTWTKIGQCECTVRLLIQYQYNLPIIPHSIGRELHVSGRKRRVPAPKVAK